MVVGLSAILSSHIMLGENQLQKIFMSGGLERERGDDGNDGGDDDRDDDDVYFHCRKHEAKIFVDLHE